MALYIRVVLLTVKCGTDNELRVGSEFDSTPAMNKHEPSRPPRPQEDPLDDRDPRDEDTPETPPTEPPPVPVKEPPDTREPRGPFVVL
jgi:hypothetical protein